MENIKINYGTSYISNSIIGSSFSLNKNLENIILNNNNGIITINDNLDVGIYNVTLNYIKDGNNMEKIYNITVLPNFFYDLNNITNNSTIEPILHPNNIQGTFSIDYVNNNTDSNTDTNTDTNNGIIINSNNGIIINSNNGIITLNNLNIGNYFFTVTWTINELTVNEITVSHLINFTIKPTFYYQNNSKLIYYGDIDFSEKPIIDSLLLDNIIRL